jgi:hypothetical protein
VLGTFVVLWVTVLLRFNQDAGNYREANASG